MPNIETHINEEWKYENGQMVLVASETIEVEIPTQEEIIAEKEAQLLAMYEELKALKG